MLSASQVILNIGSDLNNENLQDTSSYKSQQQSLGGSVSVGFGKGFSGNISASQSKVDGNYQSVIEQSAITAGDGGFQINVGGNTDLKGGKIASTDKAVEEGKNQFQTASLTMSDIRNTSEYKAESQSISAGGGYGGGKTSLNGTGVGFANESGSDSSVTTSGISGIAGNTAVRSDKDSSNALVKNWNDKELQADVEAQAKIMEVFGKQAALGIGTYATSKLNELNRQIEKETDPQKKEQLVAEASNWAEGGAYRTALHAAAGALGGGLAGAAGATLSAVSMPAIAEVIGKIDAPEAVKQALEQVAAAALGAAIGGSQGLASALNVEANNRQLHQSEYDIAKKNAKLVAQKLNISDLEAEGRILAEILRNSDKQTAEAAGGIHDYEIIGLVGCQILNCNGYKTDLQYANSNFNSQFIKPNQAAYNAGQNQIGTGQTYNDLVIGNIKKDPVGTTVAGAGVIGLGILSGGGLPALGLAGTGATIGMGVNGGVQLISNQPFDWFSFGMAGVTGASSSGMGFLPALLINTGGAMVGSVMQGQNPNGAMAGAAVGTMIGFPIGVKIESGMGSVVNPWYRQQWKDIGLGMSAFIPPSAIPSWAGGTISSIFQEKIGPLIQKKMEQ